MRGKDSKMPKGMPPKGMPPKEMPKEMASHKMPSGMMMPDKDMMMPMGKKKRGK